MRMIRALYRLWLGRAAIRDLRRGRFYMRRATERMERAEILSPRMGAVVPIVGRRR